MIKAAVLGSPINHSLSPLLHTSAYAELGIENDYSAIEVGSGELQEFLKGKENGWTGFSLTMPLKEEVLKLADVVDPIAARITSANTLFRKDGKWIASSTDLTGVISALNSRGFISGRKAIILGAGATARAVAGALDSRVDHIQVISRNPEREDAMRACVLTSTIEFSPWEYTAGISKADLLVNTTPWYGANLFVDYLPSKIDSLFFEVLYKPWPSLLLAGWKARGGESLDGIDLLVHQGLDQIELFSGSTFDRAAMAHFLRRKALATLE